MAIDVAVRAELIRRARDKRFRQSVWTSAAPCRWHPTSVLSPDSGMPFTESGAWNFIAELLEAGHEVESMMMDKPPGQVGYVLKAQGYKGRPDIYIKLTICREFVNGRSFHDSEY